jgi:hypothetical protein
VSTRNFPLPTLGPKLYQLAAEVHRGQGFALIRGLPLKRFSHEDNVVVYLGISSYIGPIRGRQDEDGNMLSTSHDVTRIACLSLTQSTAHIRDSKCSRAPQEERPARYSRLASVSVNPLCIWYGLVVDDFVSRRPSTQTRFVMSLHSKSAVVQPKVAETYSPLR